MLNVVFKISNLDDDFELMHELLNPNDEKWNWSRPFHVYYPELFKSLEPMQDIKDRKIIEHNFLRTFFVNHYDQLEQARIKFQNDWDDINDAIMNALSSITETHLPESIECINANVSLNPICPRDLSTFEFNVFYKYPVDQTMGIVIHELLHFFYFRKFHKTFPSVPIREFDSPYLAWHLSEMVVGVLLNTDVIQHIFKYQFKPYPIYHNIKIQDVSILHTLQRFFDKSANFDEFLKMSWQYLKTYEMELNKYL